MAERLFSSQTPANDDNDPGTKHSYTNRFQASVAGTTAAGRIWCPNPKPTVLVWLLWRSSDGAVLAQVDAAALSLTPGAWNAVTFSSVNLSASTNYAVGAHYEGGHHVYTASGVTFPWGNGNHLTVNASFFKNDGGITDYPNSAFDLYAFADLEFEVAVTDTTAPAENAAGTGSANAATIQLNPAAEGISGTGVSNDGVPLITPGADFGAGTGSALDALSLVEIAGGLASATGQAFDAVVSLFAAAENALGAGEIADGLVLSDIAAGLADGSGLSYDATVSLLVSAGVASSSGEAFNPPMTVAVGARPRAVSQSYRPRAVSSSDGRRRT